MKLYGGKREKKNKKDKQTKEKKEIIHFKWVIKDLKCQNIYTQTNKRNNSHKIVLLLDVLHSKMGPTILSMLNHMANFVVVFLKAWRESCKWKKQGII